jgi:hypothetical protein
MKKESEIYSYKFVKINNGIEESYFWIRCDEKDVEDIFIGVLKIIKKIKKNVER